MFDSLKYAKILEKAGLPRDLAETHIRVLKDTIGEEVATTQDLNHLGGVVKHDLNQLKTGVSQEIVLLKSEISQLRSDVSQEINQLKIETNQLRNDMDLGFQRLDNKIDKLGYQLIVKLGALMTALIGTAIALGGFALANIN